MHNYNVRRGREKTEKIVAIVTMRTKILRTVSTQFFLPY